MQVLVRDNNVEQALKVLKKKMQREGVFREMKLRSHYEKPSERRVREKAEAVPARKLARSARGLLPIKPRVIPGALGKGGPRALLAFDLRTTSGKQSHDGGKGREEMAKILCVLYDDPIGGYPKSYARDGIPKIDRYPGGQSAPTPEHIDFKPGELLGSVSGELGLRKFFEGLGHTFVVTVG